jgi:hypothetical protein
MKYPFLGLTFIFLLLVGCSINTPKNKPELIQMNTNLVSNENQLASLLQKLNDLQNKKENMLPVRILQIGDSHVQMGHFSNAIREGMQKEFGGSELGYFFPYILSGGYNPAGISVSTDSNWKSATNSKPDSTLQVGVTGATVQTIDSISNINFAFKGRAKIKTVSIYHQNLRNQFSIRCDGAEINTIVSSNYTEFTTITLPEEASEIKVEIIKLNVGKGNLSLYGVSMNQLKSEGIDFYAFGVSGNQYQFFTTLSPLFKAQVKDLYPDLIIISLGSNDAYRKDIDSVQYKRTMTHLIASLREISPKSAFLITSPPDTKYKNERPNSENTVLNSIRHTTKIMNISEWDFHSIMGGIESNPAWQKLDLANKDGLHLTNEGYQIEGALFNIALAKALKNKYPTNSWLEKTVETYQNQVSKVKGF